MTVKSGWLTAAVLALMASACSTSKTATNASTTTSTVTTAASSTSTDPTPPPTSETTVSRPRSRPYPIGTTSVTLIDGSRPTISRGRTIAPSRTITTLVWYADAPGRRPRIVFAHGFQVGPLPYAQLCETWAATGYVVAAPEFPLTDAAVAGAALDEADIENQPADVRFVVASLTSGGSLSDRIDGTRIALAGHSDGAETALATGVERGLAVRAIIALAVSPLPSGAVAAAPPLLVGQGDRDTINPPQLGQTVYDQAGRPRYLLHLRGAGHCHRLPAPRPGLRSSNG